MFKGPSSSGDGLLGANGQQAITWNNLKKSMRPYDNTRLQFV